MRFERVESEVWGVKNYFTRGEVVLLMGCDFCSLPLCCFGPQCIGHYAIQMCACTMLVSCLFPAKDEGILCSLIVHYLVILHHAMSGSYLVILLQTFFFLLLI